MSEEIQNIEEVVEAPPPHPFESYCGYMGIPKFYNLYKLAGSSLEQSDMAIRNLGLTLSPVTTYLILSHDNEYCIFGCVDELPIDGIVILEKLEQ